ncbi:H-NS histone family protein [Paracoccus sp. AS002]|uniref:H-NS histone family protein n=1 Tax=Paracoccus sp. AS002 TaxID=3019545 RepID=UPI0032047E24
MIFASLPIICYPIIREQNERNEPMNLEELNNLDLTELRQMRRDVQKAIDSFETRQRSAALAAVQAAAQEHGFKLADLLDAASARKPVAPKYQHPENPELTWTGARSQTALDRRGAGRWREAGRFCDLT